MTTQYTANGTKREKGLVQMKWGLMATNDEDAAMEADQIGKDHGYRIHRIDAFDPDTKQKWHLNSDDAGVEPGFQPDPQNHRLPITTTRS